MTEQMEAGGLPTGARQEPERHTSWVLARLAECGDPDVGDFGFATETPGGGGSIVVVTGDGSPGARFLRSVEDAVYERWQEASEGTRRFLSQQNDDTGMVHEIADAAPDVYTHTRWAEFHDLAAYNEEPGELAGDDATMTELAGVALYMIAERLAWALLEERAEAAGEESDPPWIGVSTGQLVTVITPDGETVRGHVETYDADEIHVEGLEVDSYGHKRMMLFTRDEVESIA